MSALTAEQEARVRELIEEKESQLTTVRTAYTTAVSEVESYTFNSGSASQSVRRQKLETLSQEQTNLENQIEALYRRLEGGGLANMNLRR